MEENKKSIWHIAKQFLFEIIAFPIFLVFALLLMLDEKFSKKIITGFLRPETAFTFLVVLGCLSILLVFLFLIQARKKKLKSTKKMSAFAKTVVCSHKVREMMQTQAEFVSDSAITTSNNNLPDLDESNPSVIELYFSYEVNLNI